MDELKLAAKPREDQEEREEATPSSLQAKAKTIDRGLGVDSFVGFAIAQD